MTMAILVADPSGSQEASPGAVPHIQSERSTRWVPAGRCCADGSGGPRMVMSRDGPYVGGLPPIHNVKVAVV